MTKISSKLRNASVDLDACAKEIIRNEEDVIYSQFLEYRRIFLYLCDNSKNKAIITLCAYTMIELYLKSILLDADDGHDISAIYEKVRESGKISHFTDGDYQKFISFNKILINEHCYFRLYRYPDLRYNTSKSKRVIFENNTVNVNYLNDLKDVMKCVIEIDC